MADENFEIRAAYERINKDADRNDGRAVEEWFEARQINRDDLYGYTEASAMKAVREMLATGTIDEEMLAARFAASFQIGFEVAAARYIKDTMPPTMGGGIRILNCEPVEAIS